LKRLNLRLEYLVGATLGDRLSAPSAVMAAGRRRRAFGTVCRRAGGITGWLVGHHVRTAWFPGQEETTYGTAANCQGRMRRSHRLTLLRPRGALRFAERRIACSRWVRSSRNHFCRRRPTRGSGSECWHPETWEYSTPSTGQQAGIGPGGRANEAGRTLSGAACCRRVEFEVSVPRSFSAPFVSLGMGFSTQVEYENGNRSSDPRSVDIGGGANPTARRVSTSRHTDTSRQ